MTKKMSGTEQQWVLQLCHGYEPPFLDCARQYAALFVDSPYKICTVYLTGTPSEAVETGSASDEVVFLNYSSRDIRGLKLKAIREFGKIVASRKFEFCIAHRFKPIYIALLGSKLPIMGIQHAFGVYARGSRRFFVNRFRHRLTLLGVSDAVRDDIRADLPNWPPGRIETLYNRVDLAVLQSQQLSREEARRALGLSPDALIIGNVGRLHPDKDQATLIRGFSAALARLPPSSELVIMGSGPLEKELKGLASQCGVSARVKFLGNIPEGRRFFKAFDIFALTSDHEPFGMVLLEAMAAGVLVICSDCGGGREVVEDAGLLTEQGSAEGFANALQRVCAMSAHESDSLRHKALERLQSRFSDQAAKKRFWSLPCLPNRMPH